MTASPDVAPAAVARFRDDLTRLCDANRVRLLVAVSGGPDSLALLLLARAALGDGCSAATVDHGLRPDSASEARFVASLCADRGIAHAILTGALPARAGRTANVSARARALRYRLLGAHAATIGATAIATAHHADDQTETLVMRLNRGAGVGGLAGVRGRSGDVIRPLLGWRRADLAAIVSASGIAAIDDPSNRDDRYDRARVRKVLASSDLLDVNAVVRSAAALADAEDALAWAADDLARRLCTFEPGAAAVRDAAALPSELQRRLVATCLRHLDPDVELRGEALTRLIESLESGARATLGTVLCDLDSTPGTPPTWRFSAAPPRRSR